MPREYIHWSVLEAALAATDSSLLKDQKAMAGAYIGAMLPDMPDFYLGGYSKTGASLSATLHGIGDFDTFLPVRAMLAGTSKETTGYHSAIKGLIYGYLSHIATDATFHPLVNHLSGSWYEEDLQKRASNRAVHRLLETQLDLWILAQQDFYFSDGLKQALGSIDSAALAALMAVVSSAVNKACSSQLESTFWHSALKHTTLLQRSFKSDLLARLVSLAPNSDQYTALFYYRKTYKQEELARRHSYVNRVTGNIEEKSFLDLFDCSVALTTGWFAELMVYFNELKECAFLERVGPPLD